MAKRSHGDDEKSLLGQPARKKQHGEALELRTAELHRFMDAMIRSVASKLKGRPGVADVINECSHYYEKHTAPAHSQTNLPALPSLEELGLSDGDDDTDDNDDDDNDDGEGDGTDSDGSGDSDNGSDNNSDDDENGNVDGGNDGAKSPTNSDTDNANASNTGAKPNK